MTQEAVDYVKEPQHALHIPLLRKLFEPPDTFAGSVFSVEKRFTLSLINSDTLLCAESQPSVMHRYQRDRTIPPRVLLEDDRLETTTLLVNKTKRNKKPRLSKHTVGDRVDFKMPKKRTWIAGRVTRFDSDHMIYDIIDGQGLLAEGIPEGDRMRAGIIFKVNDKVFSRFRNSHRLFKGTIAGVNENFTYQINFDDGDVEDGVTIDKIEIVDPDEF
jgi:hypothetical protein